MHRKKTGIAGTGKTIHCKVQDVYT